MSSKQDNFNLLARFLLKHVNHSAFSANDRKYIRDMCRYPFKGDREPTGRQVKYLTNLHLVYKSWL